MIGVVDLALPLQLVEIAAIAVLVDHENHLGFSDAPSAPNLADLANTAPSPTATDLLVTHAMIQTTLRRPPVPRRGRAALSVCPQAARAAKSVQRTAVGRSSGSADYDSFRAGCSSAQDAELFEGVGH
ncbi:hypothetical protein GCM10028775_32790 [Catellatospora paridis]